MSETLELEAAVSRIATDLRASPGSVLALGRPGRGKSTLVRSLLARLGEQGTNASLLAADPGQPSLGPPASFALSEPNAIAFLGSTDPMAVRLTALGELLRLVAIFRKERGGASLVVDACGLVANAIGREWAVRQAEAVTATHVVLVERRDELEPLARLLSARRGLSLVRVRASEEASAGSSNARRRSRGERLLEWLEGAPERTLALEDLPVLGVPERGLSPEDWKGRLVGLLDAEGKTLSVGLALEATDARLTLRARAFEGALASLRTGDAAWDEATKTVVRRPFLEAPGKDASPAFAIREKPALHVEPFALSGEDGSKRAPGFEVHVANGLFGDPLVHVRPLRERDGILLDLGRASSLPVKLLHRVGLVLLSHAHVDHFFGFDELLRALLGSPREVAIVGPERITERIASRIGGYSWNLIESNGPDDVPPPRFRVSELSGISLEETRLVPGRSPEKLGERPAPRGLVFESERFTVTAVALAHRDISSHAYEIEERRRLAVRPEAVAARGLSPGKWLDALKRAVTKGELDAPVEIEPGRVVPAKDLASELLVERAGQRIVYVTDAADTRENRKKIVELARGADLLVCEATFVREDEGRATATGHLPAFAAAEIAREARVGRLLPFHLSPRYEEAPERIFRELVEIFPRVQVPREVAQKLGVRAGE